MKNCKSILYALGLLLLCVSAATAGDQLTFKFKAVKIPGSTSTEPGGINNAGVSVGYYVDTAGLDHGYILNGKKVTKLDDPNGVGSTEGSNLSPDGAITVAGFYTSSKTQLPTGFVWKNGKFTDVPGPSTAKGGAYCSAINDSGEVVGYYVDSTGVYHGFLLKGGKYTTLDVPGAADTFATGINKKGEVSFYWYNGSSYESSVLSGGKYTTVNVPGAADSFALDLDAAGDVTYQIQNSSGAYQGALLHSKKYYTYSYPKAADTYGGGINDKSEVVGGYASSTSGPWNAFQASY